MHTIPESARRHLPSSYIRLLRDLPGHRWYKPLLLTLLAAVYYLILVVAVFLAFGIWWGIGGAGGLDAVSDMNTVTGLVIALVSVIFLWPALELAMLSIYQRWFFPLVSVRVSANREEAAPITAEPGGMRWRLLGRFLLLALPVWAAGVVVLGTVSPESVALDPGASWDGRLGIMLLLVLLLAPLQSMSEELVFRGLAMNVIGSWLRSPWWAVLIPVPFFVFGHIYDVPGLISVGVFAVVMGLLTLWTSGLEAAIAFHTVNNLFAFGLAILTGADLNATDAPPAQVAVAIAAPIVFALVVILDGRRRGPGRRAPRGQRRSRREADSGEVLPPRGDVVGDLPEDHLGGGV